MKKWMRTTLALLLVPILCLVIAACAQKETYSLESIQKDPAAQLRKSWEKTVAMAEGSSFEVNADVKEALKNGAIALSLNTEEGDQVSGMLYLRDDGLALQYSANDGGETNYSIWANRDSIVLHHPLLPGSPYGINLSTFKADLKNSVLKDMLMLTDEQIDEYLSLIEKVRQEPDEKHPLYVESVRLAQQLEDFVKTLEVSVTEETVALNEGEVNAYRISYSFTAENLCKMIDIFSDYVRTTKDLGFIIDEGVDVMGEWDSMMKEVKAQIREEEFCAALDLSLNTETGVIMCASYELKASGIKVVLDIDLGVNPAESQRYIAKCVVNEEGRPSESVEMTYERTNTDAAFGRKLVVSVDDDPMTIFDFTVDKKAKTFEAEIPLLEFGFSGSWGSDETGTAVQINIEGLGSCEVKFIEKADAPAVPDYRNFLTLTEEELYELFGG